MTPRIYTSEPAHKTPISQWQRDRATGRIQPMKGATLHVGRWEARVLYAVVGIAAAVVAVVGIWS
jgi:negative regulator of sigma E activity